MNQWTIFLGSSGKRSKSFGFGDKNFFLVFPQLGLTLRRWASCYKSWRGKVYNLCGSCNSSLKDYPPETKSYHISLILPGNLSFIQLDRGSISPLIQIDISHRSNIRGKTWSKLNHIQSENHQLPTVGQCGTAGRGKVLTCKKPFLLNF